VLVHRAYRHKLALSPAQELLCRQIAGCCRLIYNAGLEQRKLGYAATGRGIGYTAHTYHLKEAKAAAGFAFLRDAPAHCLQQALRDLADAFERFFTGQNRYPQPRRRGENDGFRFPDPKQIGVHEAARDNQVRLPKLGWLSERNAYPRLAKRPRGVTPQEWDGPRLFEGELKSVTIKREADGWYASFSCVVEVNPEPGTGEAVGIDRGIANSVALSTGELYHLPVISEREWRTLGSLQTVVNRRQTGSRNREKALRRLSRCRQRLARRKHDALHKLTSELAERFSLVVVEGLQIANMTASAKGTAEQPGTNVTQKAGLNRAILDQCWGELERQLGYKQAWRPASCGKFHQTIHRENARPAGRSRRTAARAKRSSGAWPAGTSSTPTSTPRTSSWRASSAAKAHNSYPAVNRPVERRGAGAPQGLETPVKTRPW